jgi:hypothetical protein
MRGSAHREPLIADEVARITVGVNKWRKENKETAVC